MLDKYPAEGKVTDRIENFRVRKKLGRASEGFSVGRKE
jgi:hypothetical protein